MWPPRKILKYRIRCFFSKRVHKPGYKWWTSWNLQHIGPWTLCHLWHCLWYSRSVVFSICWLICSQDVWLRRSNKVFKKQHSQRRLSDKKALKQGTPKMPLDLRSTKPALVVLRFWYGVGTVVLVFYISLHCLSRSIVHGKIFTFLMEA